MYNIINKIKRQESDLYNQYIDASITGSVYEEKMVELKQQLSDINTILDRKDKFNKIEEIDNRLHIYADTLDKVIRNFPQITALERLRQKDLVIIHLEKDNLVISSTSSAMDLFKFSMGVALAQYYSESISESVKRSIENRINDGQSISKPPYGYKKEGNTVIAIPSQAKMLRKIYSLYAEKNITLAGLCSIIKERFNLNFSPQQIENLLTNKFYIGYCEYKKKNIIYRHKYEKILKTHLFEIVQRKLRIVKLQAEIDRKVDFLEALKDDYSRYIEYEINDGDNVLPF